jgi:preprotein translocase subunit SecD
VVLASADGKVRYQVGPVSMTNADLKAARAVTTPGQGWSVDVTLTRAGSRHLNDLARALFPKQPPENGLAFVVNGEVQSSVAFSTPGPYNGDMAISNNFTEAKAKSLAASLNP